MTSSSFGQMFPYDWPSANGRQRDAEWLAILGKTMLRKEVNNNDQLPAGFTYLGQFLDHDLTFQMTSSLSQGHAGSTRPNLRTPAFDLDSVYGLGMRVSPHLYDKYHPGYLYLDHNRPFDLPRNSQGTALISDPRNDEHLIIAQLHLAFLKFHNAVLAQASALNDGGDDAGFEKAQRLVRWHYQWLILKQYLPLVVGQEVVDDVLAHQRFYTPIMAVPLEFSLAAFRFGHSTVQPVYDISEQFRKVPLFTTDGERDLRGGYPIRPLQSVEWKRFFGARAQLSSRISTQLAAPLLNLPPTLGAPQSSLAVTNLLHGLDLPSGQTVAQAMRQNIPVQVLTDDELWANAPYFQDRQAPRPAPLWYYILREAEAQQNGHRLGTVGAYIVAEVMIGLLKDSETSFLRQKPDWKPVLPDGQPHETFTLEDLLKVAQVAEAADC
jgi:hypothetical protein